MSRAPTYLLGLLFAALALTTKATKSLLYRARVQLKGFLNQLQEI